MAYLHYYASVPARLSLYNNCNSRDTYAKSDGLTKQFIDDEILGRLRIKLSKQELDAVSDGKLDDVFVRRFASDGSTVITRISFEPKDHTGEKSDIALQTCVIPADEEYTAMAEPDSGVMPGLLLERSLLADMLSDGSATAVSDLDSVKYELPRSASLSDWFASAGSRTVKSLLFMLLTAKKGEDIYAIRPRASVNDTSRTAFGAASIEYINSLTAVLPAYVRQGITLTTGRTSTDVFKGCTLKLWQLEGFTLPEGACHAVLLTKDANYVNDIDAYYAVENDLDYLCSLYSDVRARHSFADFSYRVSVTSPLYSEYSAERFFALIRCFRCIDDEQGMAETLADINEVSKVLRIYFGIRDALNEHERSGLLALLMQYAEHRTEMPKDVYASLLETYYGESLQCRAAVIRALDAMLEADVSRQRVIAFFDAVAADEVPVNKQRIRNALQTVKKGRFATAAADVYQKLFDADGDTDVNDRLFADMAVASSGKKLAKNCEVLSNILPSLGVDELSRVFSIFSSLLSGRSAASSAYISTFANVYYRLSSDECRELTDRTLFSLFTKEAAKGNFRVMSAVEQGSHELLGAYAKRVFGDRSMKAYAEGAVIAALGTDALHLADTAVLLMNVALGFGSATLKKSAAAVSKAVHSSYKNWTALDCIAAYRFMSDAFSQDAELSQAFKYICERVLFSAVASRLMQLLQTDLDVKTVSDAVSFACSADRVAQMPHAIYMRAAVRIAECLEKGDAVSAFAMSLDIGIGDDLKGFLTSRFDKRYISECAGVSGAKDTVFYRAVLSPDCAGSLADIYTSAAADAARADYNADEMSRIDAAYDKEYQRRVAEAKKQGLPPESVVLPARESIPEPDVSSKRYKRYKVTAAENTLCAVLELCRFAASDDRAHNILDVACESALATVCAKATELGVTRFAALKDHRGFSAEIDRILDQNIKSGGFLSSVFGR